jgi:hypothetical protein
MRLAIGREQAAIEPGEQLKLAQLRRQALPSFLASSPRQAGQAGILSAGRGSASFRRRFPGLPRSLTTLLGRGLRPRIGVSLAEQTRRSSALVAIHSWRAKSSGRIARLDRFFSG